MEAKAIVVFVLVCVLCRLTGAQIQSVSPLQWNISQIGCGSWKMCVFSTPNCDPLGNSSCFFSSVYLNNQSATFQLSGTTSGYVALGISVGSQSQNTTLMFVCGNNNKVVFFNTVTVNGTVTTPANVSSVYSVQGAVTQNLVQCTFNTSTILNISTAINTFTINIATSTITVMTGSTNGTNLGIANPISPAVAVVIPANIPVNNTNNTTNNSTNMNSTTNNSTNNTNNSTNNTNNTTNNATNNATNNNTNNSTNNSTNSVMNTTGTSGSSSLGISRSTCGSSKLCLSSQPSCSPSDPNCFFVSVKIINQMFQFELSGNTIGYVALGLSKQGFTYVFVCGNNTNTNTFFFQTATQNGTTLTAANVSTVYSYQGALVNTCVQCVFNTSTTFNINTRSNDTSYSATILSGTTNGTSLGNAVSQFSTNTTLDLSNPNALNSITPPPPSSGSSSAISVWTHVCVVLLSVTTLHFTTSHHP